MPPSHLSKTNFLNGLQCHKYLWQLSHTPEEIPPPDEAKQFVFDQGHEVGNLAKKLFPLGIDIPTDDFLASIRITGEMLTNRRPLSYKMAEYVVSSSLPSSEPIERRWCNIYLYR